MYRLRHVINPLTNLPKIMFPKKKKKTLSKQFDAYRREIFFLSKVHKVMQRSHLPPNLSLEFPQKILNLHI